MLRPSMFLLGALLLQFSYGAYAMKCPLPLGLELNCPTILMDSSKEFCCNSANNVPYCCDVGEYIQNNSAIIAGIIVGALILLIIITLCCCCFCSCCLLARRRVQRGTVLYAPVSEQQNSPTSTVPSPMYTVQSGAMVHAPPPSGPSQYPPPYPHDTYQPPLNPNYKF